MKGISLHLLLLGALCAADKVRYDGYKLYKISVPDSSGLEQLKDMQNEDGYNFWGQPRINSTTTVMIAPAKLQEFMKISNATRLDPELMMDDVQKYIDDENPHGSLRGTFNWLAYHRLDTVSFISFYYIIFYENVYNCIFWNFMKTSRKLKINWGD